jgi:hypothetical protein
MRTDLDLSEMPRLPLEFAREVFLTQGGLGLSNRKEWRLRIMAMDALPRRRIRGEEESKASSFDGWMGRKDEGNTSLPHFAALNTSISTTQGSRFCVYSSINLKSLHISSKASSQEIRDFLMQTLHRPERPLSVPPVHHALHKTVSQRLESCRHQTESKYRSCCSWIAGVYFPGTRIAALYVLVSRRASTPNDICILQHCATS